MSILTPQMAFENLVDEAMPDDMAKAAAMTTHFKCSETGSISALTSSNNLGAVLTQAGIVEGAVPGTLDIPTFATKDLGNIERTADVPTTASMVRWAVFDTSQDNNSNGPNLDHQGMICMDDFGGVGFDSGNVTFKYFVGPGTTTQSVAFVAARPEAIATQPVIMRASILHPVSGGNRVVNCYDILPGDVPADLIDRVAGATVIAETTTIVAANLGFTSMGISGWKMPTWSFGTMIFDGAVPTDIKALLIDIMDKASDVNKPLSNGYRAMG